MPFGGEVGLDPGDIVLDRDPDLPRKGTPQPPDFRCLRTQACLRPSCVGLRTQDRRRRPVRKPRPMSIAARRLYGSSLQDADWYGGWPRPRRYCARLGTQLPTESGTVCLCGFRHTSTSGLGVGASRASLIAVLAIFCTRYRVSRPPTCVVPRTLSSYGDRTFAVAGPRLWNSLPVQLRNPDITYGLFRRQLKAHLFREAWRSVTLICGALEEHLLTYLLRSRLTLNDAR